MGRSKTWGRVFAAALALTMLLTACGAPAGGTTESTGGQGTKDAAETSGIVKETGDGQSVISTADIPASEWVPEINKDKVYTIAVYVDGWPKPPEFQGNPYTQGGQGEAAQYVYEPLVRATRATDVLIYYLAEEIVHDGLKTTIKLRENATWNDGTPFTSKDVWAKFTLNFSTSSLVKSLTGMEMPDEHTVVLNWQDPAPFDDFRNLILSRDGSMNVPYHIFKEYVDTAADIMSRCEPSADGTGPFGLEISDEAKEEIAANEENLKALVYEKPVGTGAFVVENVTASDLVLQKRDDYWNAEKVYFEKVHYVRASQEACIAMMRKGEAVLRFPLPKDLMDSILAENKDVVMYPEPDCSCMGLYFNARNKPFDEKAVRKALVYALDRKPVQVAGNYFGKTFPISMLGLPPSVLETYVTKETIDKLERYEYDPEHAKKLMTEAGWTQNADGKWQDKDGETYTFTIGVSSSWPAGTADVVGSLIADQFTAFGFDTEVRVVDGALHYEMSKKGEFDLVVDWIDVSWGTMFPEDSYNSFFDWVGADFCGFERDADGVITLTLEDMNGEPFNPVTSMASTLYEKDLEKRQEIIDRCIWAANDNAYGINIYQNVNGVWELRNMSTGLPLEDEIDANGGFMPFPRDAEELQLYSTLNADYAGAAKIVTGQLRPR